MGNFVIWQVKVDNKYEDMPVPTTYDIEYEDLDKGSYRSQVTGNLIDTVISKKWSKLSFSYVNVDASTVNSIFTILDLNPMLIKAKNPKYSTDIEMEMRCSRAKVSMNELRNYNISFNLVQKTKVSGQ